MSPMLLKKLSVTVLGLVWLGAALAGAWCPGRAQAASANQPAFSYPPEITAGDGSIVSGPERQAITLMVRVFDAYNRKDAALIKKFDWRYEDMNDGEIAGKFAPIQNFRLHDVKLEKAEADALVAQILYSWQEAAAPAGTPANFSVAAVAFLYRNGGWGLTETLDMPDQGLELAKEAQQAAKHFGVEDMSRWPGLVR